MTMIGGEIAIFIKSKSEKLSQSSKYLNTKAISLQLPALTWLS